MQNEALSFDAREPESYPSTPQQNARVDCVHGMPFVFMIGLKPARTFAWHDQWILDAGIEAHFYVNGADDSNSSYGQCSCFTAPRFGGGTPRILVRYPLQHRYLMAFVPCTRGQLVSFPSFPNSNRLHRQRSMSMTELLDPSAPSLTCP